LDLRDLILSSVAIRPKFPQAARFSFRLQASLAHWTPFFPIEARTTLGYIRGFNF